MDFLKVFGVFLGGVILAIGLARLTPLIPFSGLLTAIGFVIMALSMIWTALTPWSRRPHDRGRTTY